METPARVATSNPDIRFDVPLYTVQEAALHVGVAPSTLRYWIDPKGLVKVLPAPRGHACVPFIGLAEVQFIHGLRASGLTLRAVEEGVEALRDELGADYLRRDTLAHDGRDILVRLAKNNQAWTRARDGQAGIEGVVELGLQHIDFDSMGVPQRLTLRGYGDADIISDVRFAFGQPIVAARGVRVEDLLQLFYAGESIEVVGEEYGVDPLIVQSIVRAAGSRRRAA